MPKNDNDWFLMFVQKHLSLKDAVAFKMFIMNYWSSTHPGQDIDFLEISHNESLLEGLVDLYKKHKK